MQQNNEQQSGTRVIVAIVVFLVGTVALLLAVKYLFGL